LLGLLGNVQLVLCQQNVLFQQQCQRCSCGTRIIRRVILGRNGVWIIIHFDFKAARERQGIKHAATLMFARRLMMWNAASMARANDCLCVCGFWKKFPCMH
jgi:hypothetical protein